MSVYTNLCIRCGKERILEKTWEEEIVTYTGVSKVKKSLYVCPDVKCQVKVNASLDERKKVAQERQDLADKRKQERIVAKTRPTSA